MEISKDLTFFITGIRIIRYDNFIKHLQDKFGRRWSHTGLLLVNTFCLFINCFISIIPGKTFIMLISYMHMILFLYFIFRLFHRGANMLPISQVIQFSHLLNCVCSGKTKTLLIKNLKAINIQPRLAVNRHGFAQALAQSDLKYFLFQVNGSRSLSFVQITRFD